MISVQDNLIKTIETTSYKALPALEQRYYDGWLIRYANGYSRRANSVNPIYASNEDVHVKISRCESLYKAKNSRTIFKMTDAVHPANLDEILAKKGYGREGETYVYTLSLIGMGQPSKQITIDTRLSEAWVKHFARLNQVPEHHTLTLYKMLYLIPNPTGYLSLMYKDQVIGVALGVVDEDWMGVFDVVIDKAYRRQGYGRMLMESLFHWGVTQGATTSYLQVQSENEIAQTLYRALGYRHEYSYWYRAKSV